MKHTYKSRLTNQYLHIIYRFKVEDAFVGYHKDVGAAVVFQASSQLRKMCGRWKDGEEHTTRHPLWQTALEELLEDCSLNELVEEEEGSNNWKHAVYIDLCCIYTCICYMY